MDLKNTIKPRTTYPTVPIVYAMSVVYATPHARYLTMYAVPYPMMINSSNHSAIYSTSRMFQ